MSKKVLTSQQAAERLGISNSNLERRRGNGTSPEYFKIGSRVSYLEEVIERHIAENSFRSTSEYPEGVKFPGRRPPQKGPKDPEDQADA